MSADPFAGPHYMWLRQIAGRRRFGDRDHLGTAHLIDAAARSRAMKSVRDGTVLSLSRPLAEGHISPYGKPAFEITVSFEQHGAMAHGADHVSFDCHGHTHTHLDGFNHMGLDGTWYSGWPAAKDGEISIADFAPEGLVTRGVLADIPKLRNEEWVTAEKPVTADELDRAIAASGEEFEPGDALLCYMGRDRYEMAGHPYFGGEEHRPGLGPTTAAWIVDHGVSVLAWDFLDADIGVPTADPPLPVHMLLWATGLLLLDNCHYATAIPAMRAARRHAAMLVVAPLEIAAGTGSVVNPLLLI
jgi:kynurenine formamidase